MQSSIRGGKPEDLKEKKLINKEINYEEFY